MTGELPPLSLEPLTLAERRELLRLARQALVAALHEQAPPMASALTPALNEPAAAFVSLHCAGRLRGCVGTLAADTPLHQTVMQMVVSAAFGDPRFSRLELVELGNLDIEISRLSHLVPAAPEQVCPGLHGVVVVCDEHRGVFLPQVAVQHSWDRWTLLTEVCRKAMLPPDAWTRPECELRVFVAEVFGEEEHLGRKT